MKARIDLMHVTPGVMQAMLGLERQVRQAGFEPVVASMGTALTEHQLRASQINGCAYCLDMHSKDARANGETEQRLYGLDAWRETPYYSARERAALEWTEALTLVSETHVPDDVYEHVREQFSEDELAHGGRRLRARQPREVARGELMVRFRPRCQRGLKAPLYKRSRLRDGRHRHPIKAHQQIDERR